MLRRVIWMLFFGVLFASVPGGLAQDTPADEPEAPAFRVTEVIPAEGAVQVATDAVITVIFNRPVVPLTILEEREDLPDPLTLTPAVGGVGEWLNTSIYVFRPTGLAGGATYSATVEGVTSFDGVEVEPFKWTFQTVLPQVTSVSPQPDASGVPLTDDITVEFNQPMDRESAEASFSLTSEDGEPVSGAMYWDDTNTEMRFFVGGQLELDTLYTVRMEPGIARAANGAATIDGEDAPNWTFLTVPAPSIISTSPLDGATDIGFFEGVVLNFASPMDDESLGSNIT
ncbi:MAG: Ig-like domain-containing protein, partial [Chloroflexota bacterium]